MLPLRASRWSRSASATLRAGQTQVALTTSIASGESDLRALPAEVFEGRLAGGRDVRFRSQATVTRDR